MEEAKMSRCPRRRGYVVAAAPVLLINPSLGEIS